MTDVQAYEDLYRQAFPNTRKVGPYLYIITPPSFTLHPFFLSFPLLRNGLRTFCFMLSKLELALPVDFELNVVAGLGSVESVGDESRESRNDESSVEELPIDACLWLGRLILWSRPMAGPKELFKKVAIFGPYTPSPGTPPVLLELL